MDIRRLNQIKIEDFKNIDFLELKDQILSRPHILINIALAAVTIFLSFGALKSYRVKLSNLKTQVNEANEKLESIKEQEKLNKEHKEFLRNAPYPISIESLGDKITRLTKSNFIIISNFDPGKNKELKYIYSADLKVKLLANTYEEMVVLLKEVEDSADTFRINSFSMNLQKNQKKFQAEDEYEDAPDFQIAIDMVIENIQNKEIPVQSEEEAKGKAVTKSEKKDEIKDKKE
ncbi:MAG: hypothetical protein HQL27_02220 [Candidatus Omnitrophica bacterium]|nr:hypothetical protein [Candidatus Omnitrophota bacterium]